MDGIKQKCQDLKMKPESSIEIISLLTLAPVSWSQQQISTFFGVSDHLVRRSAILKREKGLLAKPDKKQGRPI
jgi:transposase